MNIGLSIVLLMIIGAVGYLLLGGREALADRMGELARLTFFAALLALLLK